MGTEISNVGYLALPASGSGIGVLVLQEWWGLVPHIKTVADRFTEAGYVALAPDLYQGQQTTSPDEAVRLFMTLNIEQTAHNLTASADYLCSHEAVTSQHLGVVGFCMGGQLALLAATVNPNIAAVVDFYGIHPNVKPDFSKLTAPVCGIFGENDSFVKADAIAALEASIHQAGGAIETHVYPNVEHAFFNDTRPEVYNPDAAKDAWHLTLHFLQQHLGTQMN